MGNRELSQPIRELSVPGQFLTGGQICTEHRPTRAVPGVAAQTTPAQTVSWSIPITIHDTVLE